MCFILVFLMQRPESRMSEQQRPVSRMSDQQRPESRMGDQQRPVSRMSDQQRPVSRMSDQQRPMSRMSDQQRPMSRIARLQSATRPATSMRQGSAFRVSTARPPTASSGIPAHAHVNLMDRPVTQQGVSGLRTATRTSYGNRRMVHDKTYYVGQVRTKMGEIAAEIKKLTFQVNTLAKEHSTYITYEKRVKALAHDLLGKIWIILVVSISAPPSAIASFRNARGAKRLQSPVWRLGKRKGPDSCWWGT